MYKREWYKLNFKCPSPSSPHPQVRETLKIQLNLKKFLYIGSWQQLVRRRRRRLDVEGLFRLTYRRVVGSNWTCSSHSTGIIELVK